MQVIDVDPTIYKKIDKRATALAKADVLDTFPLFHVDVCTERMLKQSRYSPFTLFLLII